MPEYVVENVPGNPDEIRQMIFLFLDPPPPYFDLILMPANALADQVTLALVDRGKTIGEIIVTRTADQISRIEVHLTVALTTKSANRFLQNLMDYILRLAGPHHQPGLTRGPKGTSIEEKKRILDLYRVEKEEDDFKQYTFCKREGCSPSTLRRWMQDPNLMGDTLAEDAE